MLLEVRMRLTPPMLDLVTLPLAMMLPMRRCATTTTSMTMPPKLEVTTATPPLAEGPPGLAGGALGKQLLPLGLTAAVVRKARRTSRMT